MCHVEVEDTKNQPDSEELNLFWGARRPAGRLKQRVSGLFLGFFFLRFDGSGPLSHGILACVGSFDVTQSRDGARDAVEVLDHKDVESPGCQSKQSTSSCCSEQQTTSWASCCLHCHRRRVFFEDQPRRSRRWVIDRRGVATKMSLSIVILSSVNKPPRAPREVGLLTMQSKCGVTVAGAGWLSSGNVRLARSAIFCSRS